MEGGEGALALETGAEMLDYLVSRRVQMDQHELEWSVVAARFAQTDEYDELGFNSPIACLKAMCHMRGGAAADRVCVGRSWSGWTPAPRHLPPARSGFPTSR